MNIEIINSLAMAGGNWVIYLLLACSVLALAVIIERWMILTREERGLDHLRQNVQPRLASAEWGSISQEASKAPGIVSRILLAGVAQAAQGAAVAEEHMTATELEERRQVERRLLILGTLGNNAPFIGLFGTVLGVIKAFHDLSQSSSEGPEAVMRGLSEALVATAVGLFVAIPSVMAYNYFQKRVKDLMASAESMNRLLLARIKTKARA